MDKFKILIVDDIDENIFALKTVLKKNSNFDIKGISSAVEALSFIERETFDLILCDVQMPNMDGFEFVSMLRLRKKTANIPVIFITAHYKNKEFLKKSADLGAIDYIVKPIDEDDLVHRISSYYIFTMRERKKNIEIVNLKNSLLSKEISLVNEQYEQLYKNIADGFFIAFMDGLIYESNNVFSTMIGYDEGSLQDKKYQALILDLQKKPLDETGYVEQLKRQGYTDWFEAYLVHKDKHFIAVEIRMYVLKNFDDIEESIYVIVRDLTEKKEAEENYRANEQLLIQQSKLASLGEMLSAISHQWRQPLNVIRGSLGNIIDAQEYNELTPDYVMKEVKIGIDNINFLSQTIDDFRNFFKPTTKKELFNVYDVIGSAHRIVSAQLASKCITLSIKCEHKELEMMGYKNDLEHVIINLVNNAKDALEEVEDTNKKSKKIDIEIKSKAKKIDIFISDNANGIKEEIQNRIFDPYFTTKTSDKGTGIGLYLSKTVIEKSFKGKLMLFKSNIEGSVFLIELQVGT